MSKEIILGDKTEFPSNPESKDDPSELTSSEHYSKSPETPAGKATQLASAPRTPYSRAKISLSLKSAQETGKAEFVAKSKSNGRNVSGEIKMRAIEVDKDGNIKPFTSKQSGYDENFMTSKKKHWQDLDEEFLLTEADATFSEAFEYSRLPTNSYIHFRGDNGVTTGHSGGLIKPIDELSKNKSNKKTFKDVRQKITDLTPKTSANKREVSSFVAKTLSSTQGEHKVGSLGKKGFHAKRDTVIEKVINEARSGGDTLKKASPIKAAAEALKFVVNDTVGYKDIVKNDSKFKGITTAGLNLEDQVQREYALKHYQASRDKYKLAVLKHEGRFNDIDSETASSDESDSEISILNRKLRRTKLEEKYHGKKQEDGGRFSPLRSNTPYSQVNLENSIAALKEAKDFKETSIAVATPIPVIKPSEDLIKAEEERRSPEAKKELKFDEVTDISEKPSSKPKPKNASSEGVSVTKKR